MAGMLSITGVASPAFASKFLLETPVMYDSSATVDPKVREECAVEQLLETRVGALLGKINGTGEGTIAKGGDPHGAARLKLTIADVQGVGGGAWSGRKAITVRAQLYDGNELKGERTVTRRSRAISTKGTCDLFDWVAARVAKDLYKWVFDPSLRMADDEQVSPETADAPASGPARAEPAKAK